MKFPCVAQPQILEAVGEWYRAHYDWPDSMNFDWVDFISSLIGSDWFMAACGEKERERKEERERDREREKGRWQRWRGWAPSFVAIWNLRQRTISWVGFVIWFFFLLLLLLLFSFLKQISNSHLSLHKYIFFFYTSDVWFGSEIDKFHPPKTENWNWNWTIWNKKKFLIWISGILFFLCCDPVTEEKKTSNFEVIYLFFTFSKWNSIEANVNLNICCFVTWNRKMNSIDWIESIGFIWLQLNRWLLALDMNVFRTLIPIKVVWCS